MPPSPLILASDVGGTKTLIGLFRPSGGRPEDVVTREYATQDFDSFAHLVQTFLDDVDRPRVDAVCAGVAGLVDGLTAVLTNAGWHVDLGVVAAQLGHCPAALLNDLEAMAYSVLVLHPDERCVLQAGDPKPQGNAAIIAAGTGLGEAELHYVDGRFVPSPSEGGHADFAARNARELALAEMLINRFGRVENERVLSGPGLVNVARFTHRDAPGDGCTALSAGEDEAAAAVSENALAGSCARCVEALDMFVEAYGAEAGNLALRSVATGGIYVSGGIAPKILPAIEQGGFMRAFRDKAPLDTLLANIPVTVILNPKAGLIGASVRAAELIQRR
ncbi:MAG TPA: glucokinase [Vicinamibacterales bacterium]|nr:glucokinase [Vicinamibacterales bacterium]